jgi:hypothetical protein
MSNLSEAIAQRRRAETMAAISSTTQHLQGEREFAPEKTSLCLRVENAAGTRWLLPWACFYGACYEKLPSLPTCQSSEKLQLIFIRHEVVVLGHNLGALVPAIESMVLRELRQLPGKYDALAESATPTVVQLEVKHASP